MEKKEKELERFIKQTAIKHTEENTVQRYGGAVKEHLIAYSGVDNESGKLPLKKSLKSLSEEHINEEYKKQNIKQQAGFAAEVKSVARKNAKNILEGKENRYIRKDDLGPANHRIIDIETLDRTGKPIPGQSIQMKFVGNSPKELLGVLRSGKCHKYLKSNVLLAVGDDDFDALMGTDGAKGILDLQIDGLCEQVRVAERNGNRELAAQKQTQLDDCQRIKRNLRKSGLTRKEAVEGRTHPRLSTAKDVAKVANEAGLHQAKSTAAISGSISIIKNVVACMNGSMTPEEAASSVAADTGIAVSASYITAFSASILEGSMQNSNYKYVRNLSKTNLAMDLVSTTVTVGKVLSKYLGGELTGAQCVEALGEQGVGEIGSAMFSAAAVISVQGTGSAAIQIVAGMAGSTLGYAAAAAVYQELSNSLKNYELSVEDRIRVEAECAVAARMICQYREEMNAAVGKVLTEDLESFKCGFRAMDDALLKNDVNGFLAGNAEIQKALGREAQFRTQAEFDGLMESDTDFKL